MIASAAIGQRLLLLGYLMTVVAGTLIHSPVLLAGATLLVLLSAGRTGLALLRRTLLACLPFALAVSLGYLFLARDDLPQAGRALVVLNLRVLFLTLLAFRTIPVLDLQRALGFSRSLSFVLILATSQVLTFRRLFTDFKQALSSRSPDRVGLLTALRHGAATSVWFLRRAEHDATQITQALETRGYFLDQD